MKPEKPPFPAKGKMLLMLAALLFCCLMAACHDDHKAQEKHSPTTQEQIGDAAAAAIHQPIDRAQHVRAMTEHQNEKLNQADRETAPPSGQ